MRLRFGLGLVTALLLLCSVGEAPAATTKKTHAVNPAVATPTNPSLAVSANLPWPPYPDEAERDGIEGVVVVEVHFDANGDLQNSQIAVSSGKRILDESTLEFIRSSWKSPQLAGRTFRTPITYRMQRVAAAPKQSSNQSLEQLLSQEGFSWEVATQSLAKNMNRFDVEINGAPLTLALDTGAANTLVNDWAVKHHRLETLPTKLPAQEGLNGMVSGDSYPIKVTTVKMGDEVCNPGIMIDSNLGVSFFHGRRADGLLGLPFLKANHAVIVVNPPLLFLNPERGPSSALDTWLRQRGSTVVPLKIVDGHYQIPARINGIAVPLVLDTGCETTLLNGGFLKKNNIEVTEDNGTYSGINGETFSTGAVQLGEIDLGDFSYGSQIVYSADPKDFPIERTSGALNGLIGFDVLGRVYTVIDTSNDRVYFRPFAVK